MSNNSLRGSFIILGAIVVLEEASLSSEKYYFLMRFNCPRRNITPTEGFIILGAILFLKEVLLSLEQYYS